MGSEMCIRDRARTVRARSGWVSGAAIFRRGDRYSPWRCRRQRRTRGGDLAGCASHSGRGEGEAVRRALVAGGAVRRGWVAEDAACSDCWEDGEEKEERRGAPLLPGHLGGSLSSRRIPRQARASSRSLPAVDLAPPERIPQASLFDLKPRAARQGPSRESAMRAGLSARQPFCEGEPPSRAATFPSLPLSRASTGLLSPASMRDRRVWEPDARTASEVVPGPRTRSGVRLVSLSLAPLVLICSAASAQLTLAADKGQIVKLGCAKTLNHAHAPSSGGRPRRQGGTARTLVWEPPCPSVSVSSSSPRATFPARRLSQQP